MCVTSLILTKSLNINISEKRQKSNLFCIHHITPGMELLCTPQV